MDVDLLDRRLGLSLHCEIEEAKKRLLELWAERGKGVCGEGRGVHGNILVPDAGCVARNYGGKRLR